MYSTPLEVEVVLVQRAGHLEDAVSAADDSLRQHQGPLVGAHVLGSVPFLKTKQQSTHHVSVSGASARRGDIASIRSYGSKYFI